MKPELFHQNQLAPEDNKFHQGNGDDGKHYWLTPPALLAELSAEFGPFDFDPCPFPKPEGFDGLTCEWGQRNYVNPPFGSVMHMGKKKGPTAWVRKAITEWQKGKLVVLVFPIDKWVLMLMKAILGEHADVRNLGDVKWLATEDGSTGKGTGRHIACFVLRPRGVKGSEHVLYTDADKDRPDVICDGNGQVVLDLCKVCGLAEAELLDHPECPGPAGVGVPAPAGWWTEELERIFTAKPGTPITPDMKRAAHMALTVARGGRWDDAKQEWTYGVGEVPRG